MTAHAVAARAAAGIGAGDLDELAQRLAGMTASLGAAMLLAMHLGRLKDRRGLTPRRSA